MFFMWALALNLGCSISNVTRPLITGIMWEGVDYLAFALNSLAVYGCLFGMVEEYHRKKQRTSGHKTRKD